jgi:hypothetical protein
MQSELRTATVSKQCVAQVGRAPALGAGGWGIVASHTDHLIQRRIQMFKPLHDYVLVKQNAREEQSAGGIVLAHTHQGWSRVS